MRLVFHSNRLDSLDLVPCNHRLAKSISITGQFYFNQLPDDGFKPDQPFLDLNGSGAPWRMKLAIKVPT